MTDRQEDHSNDSRGGRLVPAGGPVPAPRDPYGEFGPYAGGAPEGSGDFRVVLFEYWRIFNKRKWLILSIVSAFVTLGALRTLMQTPLFTSSVRLQIDRTAAQVVDKGNTANQEDVYDYDFMKTQYELLQSRAIAERVASALNLGNDTDFFKPRDFSITGAVQGALANIFADAKTAASNEPTSADLERAAAGIVQGNRAVRPVPGARLVDITYSDPNPARAQKIAMAYADAFIASTIDKRFQANAYAKTFLEDQIKQLKLRLEESEKVLLDFAQKEQIVAVTEKSSIAENNLAAANTALGNLISERIKNEQLWRQVEGADAINLPQLLTNSVIDGLRGKRNALVTEYQEKLETFKPDYPVMVQINNKIKEIDRQLATEVRTIKDSLKGAYQSALSQETEMKARIDTLKADVIDLQKRSIQYNILKREVDTNRELYNGLLQRFKEVDVAGGASANNVFIIERAEIAAGAVLTPIVARSYSLVWSGARRWIGRRLPDRASRRYHPFRR